MHIIDLYHIKLQLEYLLKFLAMSAEVQTNIVTDGDSKINVITALG